jgi:hypothetical protein
VKLSRLTKIIESDGNDEELLLDKENYVKLVYFYVKKMEEINIWGRNLSIKKGGANAAICDSSPWKKIVYIEGAEKVILNGSVGFNNLEIDNVGLIENPINKDCKVNIDSNIEFPMKGGK